MASKMGRGRMIKDGTFSDTGWVAPASGLTYEEANRLVSTTDREATENERDANKKLWQLADLLVWCEDNLGDKFSQITPDPTHNRRSYTMLMRIARAWSDHERRWKYPVSVWSHSETYNLPDWMADEMMEDYATGLLTRNQLRDECQMVRKTLSDGAQGTASAGLDPDPGNGAGDVSGASQGWTEHEPDSCPLCLGAGEVPHGIRELYLEFVAERQGVAK